MKPVLVELHTFFKDQGFDIDAINIKMTNKGQVYSATGKIKYPPLSTLALIKRVIKAYKKKYQSKDWRFHNSNLSFKAALNDKEFIIFEIVRV